MENRCSVEPVEIMTPEGTDLSMAAGKLLVVLRARDPATLVQFYSHFNLEFQKVQHGSEPVHYSCATNDLLFEIHAVSDEVGAPSSGFRFGIGVNSLDTVLSQLGTTVEVVQEPHDTNRGRISILRDPEGYMFELKEAA